MVSLHKHGGSRRQSKGWEVFKPRQEGIRRGRRVDGTDPSGWRSVQVLSTLLVVSTAVGSQGAADRMRLRSPSFFCYRGAIASTPSSSLSTSTSSSVKLFLESVLCRGKDGCWPFILIDLLCFCSMFHCAFCAE